MKETKTKLGVLLVSLLVISVIASVFVLAKPDVMPDKANAPFVIPPHAVEVSPGVFYLGKAMDKGRIVQGYAFIHYKKGYGRVCDNDGVCEPELGENPSCADCKKDVEDPEEPDTSSCYTFLGRGLEWKELPVDYVIDPDNSDELTKEFVTNAIYLGAEEWDAHTSTELFNDDYGIINDGSWDSDAPDGRNELLFGDYDTEGVIAVAIMWGYFGGRPSNREIVEFDVLFDTDFTWGDATNPETPNVMDLQNIATHEIGHGAGLGDLYNTECAEQTMYGYSDYGDIEKRDLESGDIAGLNILYM